MFRMNCTTVETLKDTSKEIVFLLHRFCKANLKTVRPRHHLSKLYYVNIMEQGKLSSISLRTKD